MKKELGKAIAIGVAAGFADTAAVSGWLHRSKTHQSGFRLKPPLEFAARTVVWGTATDSNAWAWTHRLHHSFADKAGDPHSPLLQGRWGILKILYKNPYLYNKYSKELVASNQPRPLDLYPDHLEKKVFGHRKAGLAASLVGHVALNRAAGNPAYMGAVSFGVEKIMYVGAGGFVNGIGHGGTHPWRSLFTGKLEAHEDGSMGADSMLVGMATLGEGNQKYHHDHENELLFCNTPPGFRRFLRDAVGTICLKAVGAGLATLEPPAAEAA